MESGLPSPSEAMDGTTETSNDSDDHTSSVSQQPRPDFSFLFDDVPLDLNCPRCGFLLIHAAEQCSFCSSEALSQTEEVQSAPDNNPTSEWQPMYNGNEITGSENSRYNLGNESAPGDSILGGFGSIPSNFRTTTEFFYSTAAQGSSHDIASPAGWRTLAYKPFREFDADFNEVLSETKSNRKLSPEERKERRMKQGKVCRECKAKKKKCNHWDAGAPPGGSLFLPALLWRKPRLFSFHESSPSLGVRFNTSSLTSYREGCMPYGNLHDSDEVPLLTYGILRCRMEDHGAVPIVGMISHGRGARWTTLRLTLFTGGQVGGT